MKKYITVLIIISLLSAVIPMTFIEKHLTIIIITVLWAVLNKRYEVKEGK